MELIIKMTLAILVLVAMATVCIAAAILFTEAIVKFWEKRQ